jgi:small subunit ribosomal protein S7e
MQDKTGGKAKNQSGDITRALTNALQQIQDKDPELKKEIQGIKVENAAEIATPDNKKCLLVHVSSDSIAALHKVHSEVVKKLESKLSNPVVIVPTRKRINGILYRRYRGKKVPRTETLTYVYDALLQDVVFPAAIVGKRIRFPKSKGRLFKVQVDKLDRDSIEYKIGAITASYKALTNRDLNVEFS